MKRLKFAGNDKLFDGNQLKKEVIRYIFDNMEYDGEFNYKKDSQNGDPDCQVMGYILWEQLESKYGKLSSEDKEQLVKALNEDSSCYNETVDLIGDYVQDGFSLNTAEYSFKSVFDNTLGYYSKVTKWDYPDIEEPDDDYFDKMITKDHDDSRYW